MNDPRVRYNSVRSVYQETKVPEGVIPPILILRMIFAVKAV